MGCWPPFIFSCIKCSRLRKKQKRGILDCIENQNESNRRNLKTSKSIWTEKRLVHHFWQQFLVLRFSFIFYQMEMMKVVFDFVNHGDIWEIGDSSVIECCVLFAPYLCCQLCVRMSSCPAQKWASIGEKFSGTCPCVRQSFIV